ncbi:MAG: hypothetical protein IPI60_09880 [Saprospiraceae bacterium]|nr:hypothetical protein [Saprospiraceae bacterium]
MPTNAAANLYPVDLYIDTIEVQNLPSNPILADGRVLRRTAAPNRYYGRV